MQDATQNTYVDDDGDYTAPIRPQKSICPLKDLDHELGVDLS